MRFSAQIALCMVAAAGHASALKGQSTFPVDVRLGVQTASTKRSTSLSDELTGRSTSSVRGFEAILSAPKGEAGIGVRVLQGTFGDDDFSLQEALLFIGQQSFHVEGGYGRRSLFGTDSTVNFARAGGRSLIEIGGSGVSFAIGGSAYFPGDFKKQKSTVGSSGKELSQLLGWDGDTSIYYTLSQVPIYFQLGYRASYFTSGQRAESMNGVVFGTGVWLGGR